MKDFMDLRIWRKAIEANKLIYSIAKKFPREEEFGLKNQIRRASTSIASNIAEGKGKKTNKDFAKYLYQSRGSLYEVATQLIIAESLNYIQKDELNSTLEKLDILSKMIFGFIKKISG
jgi:four helix bundle protein